MYIHTWPLISFCTIFLSNYCILIESMLNDLHVIRENEQSSAFSYKKHTSAFQFLVSNQLQKICGKNMRFSGQLNMVIEGQILGMCPEPKF